MPKEDIVYMTASFGDDKPAGTGLSVGWMPPSEDSDGEVQVILSADPRHLHERIKLFAETVNEGAAAKIASPPLTRYELNKLIRALRTARDKAYGRDE